MVGRVVIERSDPVDEAFDLKYFRFVATDGVKPDEARDGERAVSASLKVSVMDMTSRDALLLPFLSGSLPPDSSLDENSSISKSV